VSGDTGGDQAKTRESAETGAAADGIDRMRKRWMLAAGVIAWLGGIIAPALSFDVDLIVGSDAGDRFRNYFLILSTILFLVGWQLIDRLPIWAFGLVALVSMASFGAYSLKKEDWTCHYFPNIYEKPVVKGIDKLESARQTLAENPPTEPGCDAEMRPFGGDARKIWVWKDVERRFLMLFGFFALAWLSLALLVLGAVSYSLKRKAAA